MKMNVTKIISVILTLIICSVPIYAHSGRTDSNGGHRDKNNISGLGSYHYHHGYPAHLHPDGICPYGGASGTTSSKSGGSGKSTSDPYSYNSSAVSSTTKSDNITASSVVSESADNTNNASDKPHEDNSTKRSIPPTHIAAIIFILIYAITVYLSCNNIINQEEGIFYKPYFDSHSFNDLYQKTKELILKFKSIHKVIITQKNELYSLLTRFITLYNQLSDYVRIDSNGEIHSELLPNGGYIYTSLYGNRIHYIEGCSGAFEKHNLTYIYGKNMVYCKKCCNVYYNRQILDLIELHQETKKVYNYLKMFVKVHCNSDYYNLISKIIKNMTDLRGLIMNTKNVKALIQNAKNYNELYELLKEEQEQTFNENIHPFSNDEDLELLNKRADELNDSYEKIFKKKNKTIRILACVNVLLVIVMAVIAIKYYI